MKKFHVLLMLMFMVSGASAQTSQPCSSCLPEGIIFATQAQIDSFLVNYPGCSQIEGNVEIVGNEITNLNGLSVITAFLGNLFIGDPIVGGGNPNLLSLSGLEGLTYVGGILRIGNNDRLKDLNGLNSLSWIGGGLNIGGFNWHGFPNGNDSLETLTGLNNLTYLGSLSIVNNPLLINLEGLEGLTAIPGDVYLLGCNNLTSLSGLDRVNKIGFDLKVFENNLLTDLSGLESLDTIGGSLVVSPCGIGGPEPPPGANVSLISLNGLQHLTAIGGDLRLGGSALKSLEALSSLKSVGYKGGIVVIWICGTDSLTSLSGLDHIEAGSINRLSIDANISLSMCDIESICTYLASPDAVANIGYNAPGCNSKEEVEEDCANNCLPEGITFTSQSQIDSFRVNYPVCEEIYGDVIISGEDITSLDGLKDLKSIGGNLYINNNTLLYSLTGLDSLTSIGGGLYIRWNDALTSLQGLENIKSNSVTSLTITDNTSLSECDVKIVCDYLTIQTGPINIENNATGCGNIVEVATECGIYSTEDIIKDKSFSIYPNPFSDQLTIDLLLDQPDRVHLDIMNHLGQVIATILDESLSQGEHQVTWNAERLPAGIYFYRFMSGERSSSGKMVVVK